jgi:2-dehydropantoate 2-reductase
MRICIFGAGAVGGHIAARLAASGHEVSVVARGAQLEAVREAGLLLRSAEQHIRARVSAAERPRDLGRQDAVFVTLKATGLRAFAEGAQPLLGPDTACVFLQNGIPWWYARGLSASRPAPPDLSRLDPNGGLARAIGFERVVGAVVYSSNDVVVPGVIHNHTPGRNMLVLGEIDDRRSARVDALRAALDGADISSPPADDIRAAVWDKLVVNLASALCVPLGEPIGAVLNDAALAAVRERILHEGRAIAAAHGIDPASAPKRPGPIQGSAPAAHKPSILQDYERARPMEVEAMLKTPLAFARAAGVAAPALETLAAIVARLAAARGLYP